MEIFDLSTMCQSIVDTLFILEPVHVLIIYTDHVLKSSYFARLYNLEQIETFSVLQFYLSVCMCFKNVNKLNQMLLPIKTC